MKRKIYVIIVLLLLFVLCFFSIKIITIRTNTIKSIQKETTEKIEGLLEETHNDNQKQKKISNVNSNSEIWLLVIPSLEVKAQIKEGVSSDILKYYIRTLRRNE